MDTKKIILILVVIAVVLFLIFGLKKGDNGNSNNPQDNPVEENVTIEQTKITKVNVDKINGTQARAIVNGSLSVDCSSIGSPVTTQKGSKFTVTIEEKIPDDQECLAQERSFSSIVNLDMTDLESGEYEVSVNGTKTTFAYDATASEAPVVTPEPEVTETTTEEVTVE